MKLIEYTKILRSKNAGPLYITFDLIFEDIEKLEYVANHLHKEAIAAAYGVKKEDIDVIEYRVVNAIKITFPRKTISGALHDTDVYGCQMQKALAEIEV